MLVILLMLYKMTSSVIRIFFKTLKIFKKKKKDSSAAAQYQQ